MAQYGWDAPPPAAVRQVDRLVAEFAALLARSLVGVYLHGSLAMGCFNPDRSDLDLLVVTEQRLGVEAKRRMALALLDLSGQPFPVEISVLSRGDLTPWRFPTPYDFHYGEELRARLAQQLSTGEWLRWNEDLRTDPDLAAHITMLRHRGVVLRGAPIDGVFPPVPERDYFAAIWEHDCKGAAERIEENPVYAVLNLCRTLAWVVERRILSKEEGGRWGEAFLPEPFRGVVRHALSLYRGETAVPSFDGGDLREFTRYMEGRIEAAGRE